MPFLLILVVVFCAISPARVAAQWDSATAAHLARGDTAAALGNFRAIHRRSQVVTLDSGVHLLNDCYNANPGSMAMALSTLMELKDHGRAAAALADMLELGNGAAEGHRELGRQAARLGLDLLVIYGNFRQEVAAGAVEATDPAHVAAASEIVVVCVSDTADVEAVVTGPGGIAEGAAAGSLVIDCSTIAPAGSWKFAERLDGLGLAMVDAPVSGGSAANSSCSARTPPAEAPMPTTRSGVSASRISTTGAYAPASRARA